MDEQIGVITILHELLLNVKEPSIVHLHFYAIVSCVNLYKHITLVILCARYKMQDMSFKTLLFQENRAQMCGLS